MSREPAGCFFCFFFPLLPIADCTQTTERHAVLGVTAYAVTGLIYSGVCDNHEAIKNKKSTGQISPRNLTILWSTQTDCDKKYKPYTLSLLLNCLICFCFFFLTTQRVSTHFSRALLRVFMFSWGQDDLPTIPWRHQVTFSVLLFFLWFYCEMRNHTECELCDK